MNNQGEYQSDTIQDDSDAIYRVDRVGEQSEREEKGETMKYNTADYVLRHVRLDGYTLQTWDTGERDSLGKTRIAYEMRTPDGKVLFEGNDFRCSPMHAIDSDECLRHLLGFLTLKPGDTDADYFDNYTPEQMAFAEGDAEDLQLWSVEPDEGYEPFEFENLDDWTNDRPLP